MNRILWLLSVWLALPTMVWAAAGDPYPLTIPSGQTKSGIESHYLCDVGAAGAFTCGPIYVPGGGANVDVAVIRALRGTATLGCGYDDVNVYTVSTSTITNPDDKASIGLLDDDGSSSGVKQIVWSGPIGPYLYLEGTATDGAGAGDCSGTTTNRLQILLHLWKKQP